MRSILTRFAGVLMFLQFLVLSALPAVAISVDLAKKCREMAIKAHPRPHGHKPYAQAERDFFGECVSKNGKMQDSGAPKARENPE